ncbi:hypothetical protein HDU92_007744 [Lobulomyces angularis]|nr:hypothetical protein HDU92_007744 [Lobulomyces angularis]
MDIKILEKSDSTQIKEFEYESITYSESEKPVLHKIQERTFTFRGKLRIDFNTLDILENELIDIHNNLDDNISCKITIYYKEDSKNRRNSTKCIEFESNHINKMLTVYREKEIYISSIKIERKDRGTNDVSFKMIDNKNKQDFKPETLIKEFDRYDSGVIRIRNACDCRLYCDHVNGCVTVWNTVTGTLLNTRYDYKTVIRRYFYYKDYLYGACDDGTIRIWNSNKKVCKAIIKVSDSPVIEMIMMYDYIYVICDNGYITKIDNKATYPLLSNNNHPITINMQGDEWKFMNDISCCSRYLKMKWIRTVGDYIYFEHLEGRIIRERLIDLLTNVDNSVTITRIFSKIYSSTVCDNKIYISFENGSIIELDFDCVKEIYKIDPFDKITHIVTSFSKFLFIGSTDGSIKQMYPKLKICVDIDIGLEPIVAMHISNSILYVALRDNSIRQYEIYD